jgi:hypothetical protein
MAEFLGTEPLNGFAAIFKRERLPVAARTGALADKLAMIDSLATPENVARLVEAGRRHEKAWALPPMAT